MTTSSPATEAPAAKRVRVTDEALIVELQDGQDVKVPLRWYPQRAMTKVDIPGWQRRYSGCHCALRRAAPGATALRGLDEPKGSEPCSVMHVARLRRDLQGWAESEDVVFCGWDEVMTADAIRLDPALPGLCRRSGVRRLDFFGSASSGADKRGHSDLDFLVEFATVASATYADNFFGFKEALERLFGRPVNLVVASAIKNPYLRESVERGKQSVYAA